jgi:hypothetical protein
MSHDDGSRHVGLHTHLLAGLTEERATLLVRPDAAAARSAYLSWSYRPIGRLQPFPDGPIYDAMMKDLLDAGRSLASHS